MKKILLTLTVAVCTIVGAAAQSVITRTTVEQGALEGVEENGLGVFKAIPYAKPPVGELRWRPPVKLEKREGV